MAAERRDTSIGVFAEYGLTDRLTLQFKGDWQDGPDAFVDYEGRGPVEVGVTWPAWRSDAAAFSLYGGYASSGEGRNAGYAAPGVGDHDWEARASAGRSFDTGGGVWPERTFIELQAARRFRSGLPDETRIDATVGGHFGDDGWCWARPMAGSPTAMAHAGCRSRLRSCARSDRGACRRMARSGGGAGNPGRARTGAGGVATFLT